MQRNQNKNFENPPNDLAPTGYHQYQQYIRQRNEIHSNKTSTLTPQLSLDEKCSEYHSMNIALSADLLKTQQVFC